MKEKICRIWKQSMLSSRLFLQRLRVTDFFIAGRQWNTEVERVEIPVLLLTPHLTPCNFVNLSVPSVFSCLIVVLLWTGHINTYTEMRRMPPISCWLCSLTSLQVHPSNQPNVSTALCTHVTSWPAHQSSLGHCKSLGVWDSADEVVSGGTYSLLIYFKIPTFYVFYIRVNYFIGCPINTKIAVSIWWHINLVFSLFYIKRVSKFGVRLCIGGPLFLSYNIQGTLPGIIDLLLLLTFCSVFDSGERSF